MKFVQIAVLALMVLTVGLLFEIYRTQGPRDAEPAQSGATEGVTLSALTDEEELQAPATSKPSALKPAQKRVAKSHAPPPKPEATASAAPAKPAPEPVDHSVPSETPPAAEPPTVPKPAEIQVAGMGRREPEAEVAPEPRRVTLTPGTVLVVRLSQKLSSDRNYGGDTFSASLDEPLVVDELVIAEKGAHVEGRVLKAERAGRIQGLSRLSIDLVRLDTADGQRVDISTNRLHRQSKPSRSADAKKVGLGAGIGAIIGAIVGGGKGAAIGAGVGAGAGGGAVAATRGKSVEILPETRLRFRLLDPLEIVENL